MENSKIVLPACTESIPSAVDFVSKYLQKNDINCVDKMAIVVDEIFSNIAHYAYKNVKENVIIICSYSDALREFTITFIDTGSEYNPLTTPEPDVTLPLEKRAIGGLGLFIVKKFMDKLNYERKENKNVLTLKKKF